VKVLIIQSRSNSNLVSGEDVVINNDIEFLEKAGIQVFYKQIKIPVSGWGSIIKKICGVIWSPYNYKIVKSAIHTHKPDIVHFHTVVPYLSFSVIAASYIMGVPIVQTLHNGRWLCLEGGYFRNNTFCDDCVGTYGWLGVKRGCGHGQLISFFLFLNNFIVRKFGFLFKFVSCFIAVSEFTREQHTRSSFPEKKIIVRNNGFNVSSEPDLDKSWLRRDGVVYAGRLSVAKGSRVLEYLIKNLDCKISIIGNGPELNSLKQMCIDNQFDHVDFFGRLDNKLTLDIIKKAVVTVVPSQCGDSYPSVALESLSVGTPIVSSNLGGLPELVKASLGGKLADYENNNSFLKAVKFFLGDRGIAKKMGVNGMKYIKENVSSHKQSKELIKIYNDVIKNHRFKK
tara:strand:+ start:481 stop:1671 length:1191 start_codon:yes stop_codon:yes gene_type:complete